MIKVPEISIDNIKNNKFVDELPEFYELKKIVENNPWHANDPVFNHTLNVLIELEKSLKSVNNKISSYLDQSVDKHTRKQLLFLGTLFHDIAKEDTIVEEQGLTTCDGHEERGSEKVKAILDRIDLSEKEKEIVADIVKYHGKIHIILEPDNDKLEEQYQEFKSEHKDIFLELILLAMADTMGSQLKDSNPKEYKFRIDFYEKELSEV